MRSLTPTAKKVLKKQPLLRNIVRNNYKCPSPTIEKYILGALVKCREILYNNPNLKPLKNDLTSKDNEQNYKASAILNDALFPLRDEWYE